MTEYIIINTLVFLLFICIIAAAYGQLYPKTASQGVCIFSFTLEI